MRRYHKSYKALDSRESEHADGDAVHGYSIITTDHVVLSALENDRGHSTTSTFEVDGRWITLALVTTRPLPAFIEAEPAGSDLRVQMARSWRMENVLSARQMIRDAYPRANELVAEGIAAWDGGDLRTSIDGAARLTEVAA